MSADTIKDRLLRELWDRDDRYYDLARDQVRMAANLPGEYEFLRRWLPVRGTVLEVGCGEGSNLTAVERSGLQFVGCDLSALGLARARAAAQAAHDASHSPQSAVRLAPGAPENSGTSSVQRRDDASATSDPVTAPSARRGENAAGSVAGAACSAAEGTALPEFLRADAERLPFPNRAFDGAFAVSLLEHLPDPETVIEEMIRVLAPGGRLILISPQYGGPLGASPCRRSGGAGRFLRRLARAHLPWRLRSDVAAEDRRSPEHTVAGPRARRQRAAATHVRPKLGWDRVEPLVLQGEVYDGDLDAVIEPELSSLARFLCARGVTIEAATSGFEWHTWRDRRASLGQRVARAVLEPLGRAGIAPYRDFGPLVAIAGYKEFRE